jgi:hypothetical protein
MSAAPGPERADDFAEWALNWAIMRMVDLTIGRAGSVVTVTISDREPLERLDEQAAEWGGVQL